MFKHYCIFNHFVHTFCNHEQHIIDCLILPISNFFCKASCGALLVSLQATHLLQEQIWAFFHIWLYSTMSTNILTWCVHNYFLWVQLWALLKFSFFSSKTTSRSIYCCLQKSWPRVNLIGNFSICNPNNFPLISHSILIRFTQFLGRLEAFIVPEMQPRFKYVKTRIHFWKVGLK